MDLGFLRWGESGVWAQDNVLVSEDLLDLHLADFSTARLASAGEPAEKSKGGFMGSLIYVPLVALFKGF